MAKSQVRKQWPCPDGYREITAGEQLPEDTEIYDRKLLAEGRSKCLMGFYLGWSVGGWLTYRPKKTTVNCNHSTPHYWLLVQV